MNSLTKSFTTLLTALAFAGFSAGVAQAAPAPIKSEVSSAQLSPAGEQKRLDAASSELTPEQFKQGVQELKDSALPRKVKETATETATTYTLEAEGHSIDFTVVEEKSNAAAPRISDSNGGSAVEPRIGGGKDSRGLYVLFNQFDQDALLAGTAWALGAAICAIPGVGWLACSIVGLVLGAATLYLSHNGKCPNNKQLKVWESNASACV